MADKKAIFNWQLFIGFVLVVTGGLFLADQFLDVEIMKNFWPLLVVLLGLTFFVGMILAKRRGAWLAIPGAVITTTGIILFIHNTFDLWVTWTYAWALLISAVGIGMLIMNIYLHRKGLKTASGWVIGIGLVLFVLFGIFFEVILDLAGLNVNSGIFLGSGLILLGLFVVFSRLIFSDKPQKAVVEESSPGPSKMVVEEKPAESMKPTSEERGPKPEPEKKAVSSPLEEGVDFSQLAFDVAGEVFIEQADTCTLRIEGEQEFIDMVKADVVDGSLSITLKSDQQGLKQLKGIGQESRVQYFVTVKSIDELAMSGVGDIHADQLSGESLRILHSGEGKIMLKGIEYQELEISMEGLGEIELQGEVQKQDVILSGLGAIKAEALKTQETNLTVSGAGTARVWVEGHLIAELTGAGSILYKGQPVLETTKTGLGNIKPLEID